jgi:hypothetical protein
MFVLLILVGAHVLLFSLVIILYVCIKVLFFSWLVGAGGARGETQDKNLSDSNLHVRDS